MTCKLPPAGEDRWTLARHARLIVYEAAAGDQLVTIYDCGAAQKPPSAQFIGNLVRVRAPHNLEWTPTGYVVTLSEGGMLIQQDEDHYVVESG